MTMEESVLVVTASTDITLWVSRGAAGDLTAGAMDVLTSATPVAAVEEIDVVGCRPTATDIRVDLVVEVQVRTATTETGAVEAALCDGFGIITADVSTVRT
ncbi:hypothetical protein [Halocatena pleomorpha]|uniref:Uncharacterized protein n=1 Tax=Halocatena pleomorpha TaxID=1785090 RepID=A0A3P3R3V7_9EURY|nr:hypothetical protein [Halocatena pleomorpha]RRJ28035.1 hypothetical protein EIK79_16760 [Halocatena pleomorpha]